MFEGKAFQKLRTFNIKQFEKKLSKYENLKILF